MDNKTISYIKFKYPDIKGIKVNTNTPGINGWVVDIHYTDDKHATFSVDRGSATDDEMVFITKDSIMRQLKHHEETMSNNEIFSNKEFDEAEHKLQNHIRITTNVEGFTTEVYTGLRWIPVREYVVGLIAFVRNGGET